MPKINILQPDREYTYRSYFEMPYGTDEILAEFNYTFSAARLSLSKTTRELDRLPELKQRIEDILPFVRLSSETARREMLVSPVLIEIVRYCQCQLRIEYPLNVNNWLKGNLDYLLIAPNNLIVIEAKHNDLTRGFTQLAVELIAISQVEERNVLYGAVTIGNIWQFGKLDRSAQSIVQDIKLYDVPDDLDDLAKILVGILELKEE